MKENKNDIFGQYASDAAIHGRRSNDTTGTLSYRGDGDQAFHQEGVFGTAEADPTEGSYAEDISVRTHEEALGRGVLHTLDEADKWLMQEDKTYRPEDYR